MIAGFHVTETEVVVVVSPLIIKERDVPLKVTAACTHVRFGIVAALVEDQDEPLNIPATRADGPFHIREILIWSLANRYGVVMTAELVV
jgi:hypothetical protein